jgi:drug/metabolite transporter (DMT)-like permease
MVTWNYLVAATLTAVVLQPPLDALRAPHAPWLSPLALAVVLPSIFLVLGRAVAVAGIVRSDVAQRLSLLLSLAAAFLFFGQTATPWKLAGLGLGLLAMVAISLRPRDRRWRPHPVAGAGCWAYGPGSRWWTCCSSRWRCPARRRWRRCWPASAWPSC